MRDLILDRAIELFNERGVEYVGVRELAREMGLKGGNITYYFPTRDDLVVGVAMRLRDLNDATMRLPERPSLAGYLAMMRQAFRNHWEFRGLFLSMPTLMLRNEKLAAGYVGTTEKQRRRLVRSYLDLLRAEGYLRSDIADEDLDRTVTLVSLVSRSWISDASLSFREHTAEWCMEHYLHVVADHLRLMATAKGRRDIARAFSTAAAAPASA